MKFLIGALVFLSTLSKAHSAYPPCDEKAVPGNCEVVLERQGADPKNCSVGEGKWEYPAIESWTRNDLTDVVHVGENTQTLLCEHWLPPRGTGCRGVYTANKSPVTRSECPVTRGLSSLAVYCVVKIITCPEDREVLTTGECTADIPTDFKATASHIDGGTVTVTHNSSSPLVLGDNVVAFTASDGFGNTTTCTATVTVVDKTPPSITACPDHHKLVSGTDCMATVPSTIQASTTDNCDGDKNVPPNDPGPIGLGTHSLTYSFSDVAGNSATVTCTDVVTVVDETPPSITACPVHLTLVSGTNCMATVPSTSLWASTTDNCDGDKNVPPNPGPIGLGTHNLTYSFSDAAGTPATATCIDVVTVVAHPLCFCPCIPDVPWKNHGEYVSCVAHAADDLVSAGLVTEEEKDVIVSFAGQSDCGKKKKKSAVTLSGAMTEEEATHLVQDHATATITVGGRRHLLRGLE